MARKNKDRLHKEIERLQKQQKKERKRADKYRKRYKRATQGTSPQSKVKNLTRTGRVNPMLQKTLLFHEALIADIKNKYQNTRRQKEKQLISKITVGKIIRKYRLQGFAEKNTWILTQAPQYSREQKLFLNLQTPCKHLCSNTEIQSQRLLYTG